MEQAVSGILIESLTECGKVKPKYPYHSLAESATKYVSYYLKGNLNPIKHLANNPKMKPWVRENYQRKLINFVKSFERSGKNEGEGAIHNQSGWCCVTEEAR
jgi:hypothetical protein